MRKAIIAGGGIGGLTAALCFHHHGWSVEIFEKSSQLGEVGAGIQISPNAMKVFEVLGLGNQLIEAGFLPEGIELRMGESGLRLLRAPLGDNAVQRWGSPYLHIHRADLIDVLRAAVECRLPGALRLGSTVETFRFVSDRVEIDLEDRSQSVGDVLIGADGIHSSIRSQMLGPDKPNFTGNVAWRSVVPVERLNSDVPDPVVCAWMGRGKHAVTYLLRGGKLANLVAVVERDTWTKESWTEPGHPEEALKEFSGWHPVITRLLQESERLYRWALYDRAPLERWVTGRAAILGDAAHPMLPFMAQGAAMAIEDAWAVAACASSHSSLPEALKEYQALRYARATKVQAGSRANAQTFHKRSIAGRLTAYGPMWLAGRVAPQILNKRQDTIYGYDVTKVVS